LCWIFAIFPRYRAKQQPIPIDGERRRGRANRGGQTSGDSTGNDDPPWLLRASKYTFFTFLFLVSFFLDELIRVANHAVEGRNYGFPLDGPLIWMLVLPIAAVLLRWLTIIKHPPLSGAVGTVILTVRNSRRNHLRATVFSLLLAIAVAISFGYVTYQFSTQSEVAGPIVPNWAAMLMGVGLGLSSAIFVLLLPYDGRPIAYEDFITQPSKPTAPFSPTSSIITPGRWP
jgi:hypothetical protein